MKKRKVLAITGIRSEYDIIYPILSKLQMDNEFELKLVVSGAHLSDWHGYTYKFIENDGFEIAERIDSLLMTNRVTQRIKGIGVLTYALAQTVERENPDFLLVVGDREESIATALVGNYMNVLVAHIGGGDPVYGNADDPIRFAVSKLAHLHLTLADEYSKNLENVGEEKFRIFNVGDPSLDNIRNTEKLTLAELSNKLNFDISDGKYVVLINHPLSSEKESAYDQMIIVLKSVVSFCEENGYKAISSYPNTDPGSNDILKAIEIYKDDNNIKFYKNLERTIFVNVMRSTKALVGNSSMGILEAPFYKLPVVNIGNRQRGRLNAGNVNFVDHDINLIKNAISKACFDMEYRNSIKELKNPFGDGNSAEKTVNVLKDINLNDRKWFLKKKLC